jgi:hypothetical protein
VRKGVEKILKLAVFGVRVAAHLIDFFSHRDMINLSFEVLCRFGRIGKSKKRTCKMTIIESLPNILINISNPPREFLQAISLIAQQSGRYQVENHFDFGGMDIVNFCPYDQLVHEGLLGQLIHHDGAEHSIRVEIRASRWVPEYPPRSIYIEAAQHIFAKLIKSYNSQNNKRYRMRIVPDKYFILPPKSNKAFKQFADLANKSCLHPLDWNRLYRFVRICHATRVCPSEEQLRGLLFKEGFTDDYAAYISDIAYHCYEFMKTK